MNKVANLPEKERRELFSETANKIKTTNAIVEKDFWVVWALDKIFSYPELKNKLMFKGGTSLSKIYGLIERFSEDIDLILNWNLLTNEDPFGERSNNKQDSFNKALNEKAREYIENKLLPLLRDMFSPQCDCSMAENKELAIKIQYPALFSDTALLPHVLLEIGPLAEWSPSGEFEIRSFAAQEFPHLFENKSCKVKAVLAKRTFWEKATILHQETNRAENKKTPIRYSRHYYDLALMARSEIKDEALDDLKLLDDVIRFNNKLYPCAWAKFDEAKAGTFKLIPPEYRHKELIADYKKMRSLIFGEYVEFDRILEILQDLEEEINLL